MNKLKYKCSICSKKFSRKWNAQRHNNTMHKDVASIKYSSIGKLSSNNQSKIYPYGLNISKFKTSKSKLNNNKIKSSTYSSPYPIKSFNNFYQNNSNKYSIKSINEDEKENLLYNKLEKMIIPFEKLEKLFVMEPSLIQGSGNIDTVLSNIIITALGQHDPAKFVHNHLSFYSGLYYRNKMILCVSRSLRIDILSTVEYLKSLLTSNNV
jgi:hypothetical protein